MKKVISYALIIAIMISICFIPASAAAYDGTKVVDLLESDYITAFFNGRSVQYKSPDNYNTKDITFSWGISGNDLIYQTVIVTYYSAVKPSSFYIGINGSTFTPTYINSYNGYHQYRLSVSSSIYSISVRAVYSSTSTGNIGLIDVLGYSTLLEPVSSVRVYDHKYFQNSSGQLIMENLGGRTVSSFPSSKGYGYNFINWYYNVVHVDIQPGNILFDTYERVNLELLLPNPYTNSTDSELNSIDYWNDKIGFSVYESGRELYTLPVDISVSNFYGELTFSDGSIAGTADFGVIRLSLSVDLSGIDLNNKTLDFNVKLIPFLDTNLQNYGFVYYKILDVSLVPLREDMTWYQRFWFWIQKQWNNATTAIVNTIEAVGDRLAAAFQPGGSDDPTNPQLPDVNDQLATDASKFHDEMDVIETVPKPTIDPGDLPGSIIIDPPDPSDPEATEDTQGYVDPSDPAGTDIMTTLTSAPNFFPAVTIVLTIAIVSLLLYGVGG